MKCSKGRPRQRSSVRGMEDEKELIRALVKNGMNKNIKNKNGWTALMLAAFYCHEDIVDLLLEPPSAEVHIQTREGNTALMLTLNTLIENSLIKAATGFEGAL